MKTASHTILAATLLFAAFGHAAKAADRVALVIGNGDYQNVDKLANPVNDVNAMAVALRKADFDVILVKDSTREQMDKALVDMTNKAKDAKAVWFFYAGHGVEIGGENFLLPVDFSADAEYQVKHRSLSLNQVLDAMDSCGAALKVVTLDSCRDNPFARGFSRSISRGLAAPVNSPSGTIIAFAAAPGKVALDGNGTNSPFTTALVQSILTPGLEISEVFNHTGRTVMEITNQKQEPWINHSFFDSFVVLEVEDVVEEVAVASHTPVETSFPVQKEFSPALKQNPATIGNGATDVLSGLGLSRRGYFSNSHVFQGGPFESAPSTDRVKLVSHIQQTLPGAGNDSGWMNRQTQEALVTFQARENLPVSGRIDEDTAARLNLGSFLSSIQPQNHAASTPTKTNMIQQVTTNQVETIPAGTNVPNNPGFVYSPHSPNVPISAQGRTPGQVVLDPLTKEKFTIPADFIDATQDSHQQSYLKRHNARLHQQYGTGGSHGNQPSNWQSLQQQEKLQNTHRNLIRQGF